LLWQSRFWLYAPPVWRVLLSILFFIAASVLSWTSVRELGRQWRVDAGLNPDHQLIRTGPYAIVRHPIYTSMLCLFLAIGLLVTPWIRFLVALLVFLAGCGIRMQVENRLLAQHFGAEFAEYKRSVPAMIPGLPKTLLQSR
ncbi:MAG TPA: isoprenylcysteine carboxylmethyltransferase family protein, partial [Chloroflexota bacterium]|nr:isoprenylcysteine carboxylmethyltransferase family protein [Chloroflexota bacterium]